MLDIMRRNAQSWIVKVLFGVIVIVFVFWGVGSFTEDDRETLAVINGEPISIQEFARAYESTAHSMREQNPGLSREDMRSMQLREQVFNQMVNSKLLVQKASQLGLSVSREQLQQEITSLPAFFDEANRFDPQRYEQVLRSHRLTPSQFERDFRHNLLMEKMEEYVSLPAKPNEHEVQEFFNYVRSQAKIDYKLFEADEFHDKVSITEEQIKEYYQDNQDRFMEPEKIRIAHLELSPDALAGAQRVSSEEVEAYFQSHQSEFEQPEEVKARHILVEVEEDAPELEQEQARERIEQILAELEMGQSFEELAREHSQCPSAAEGGDLGRFGRGEMVEPFEEAAFDLTPGEVSSPVQTRFGWHLIKVEEYVEAASPDLEEVEDEIRRKIGREKAADQIGDYADDVLEIVVAGGSLEEAAGSLGLKLKETGYFSREQGPEELELPGEALDRLFNLMEGEVTESPIMLDNGYLYAEKTGVREARSLELEEVEEEIVQELTRQKSMEMAENAARDMLDRILDEAVAPGELDLVTSEPFDRQGFIPGLGMNPQIAEQAFARDTGIWLPEVKSTDAGYILARVKEHIQPDQEQFEQEKEQWMQSYAQMQRQQLFNSYITMLRARADINMVRPEVLDN